MLTPEQTRALVALHTARAALQIAAASCEEATRALVEPAPTLVGERQKLADISGRCARDASDLRQLADRATVAWMRGGA